MATPTTLPATFVAGNVLTAAQMNNLRGAFRILQVVQTVKTDTFSTASTTYVDITGLSVSITPSSTSSKVLVFMDTKTNSAAGSATYAMQLVRGSTGIYIGDAAGSRFRATYGTAANVGDLIMQNCSVFLDSPATTSATTYKVQLRTNTASTIYLNRTGNDPDSGNGIRTASSITVMEISA